MKVKVLYFAKVKEQLGAGQEIDLALMGDAAPKTVGQLHQHLCQQSLAHAQALALNQGLRAALNQTMCELHAQLPYGDTTASCEVAFFPPVTGG
jgi:molybdopterin converting factor small subunit